MVALNDQSAALKEDSIVPKLFGCAAGACSWRVTVAWLDRLLFGDSPRQGATSLRSVANGSICSGKVILSTFSFQ